MILQKVKPTTSSRRQLIKLNQKSLNLSKKPILKTKIKGMKNSSGRNNSGKITIFHKGGGVKQKYREINFHRTFNSTGIVCSLEYDPNRNAYIAAVFDFINSYFFYILAPKSLKIGDIIKSGAEIEPSLGSSLPISGIPIGTPIYNVSPMLGKKAQISRSAGTFSIIKEKMGKYAIIELSSGELRYILSKCFASIGEVSKELHFLTRLGKAGQSRWLNKRPTVRGVAMNPIDHPHGGGEGKKSGSSKTPWGKPNQRGKTSKSTNKLIIKKKLKLMKRAKWKGPFVNNNNNSNVKLPLLPRNFEVTSSVVGLTGNVYSGKKLVKISLIDEMIGHKIGEFSPTREKFVFKKKKKKK